jgi:hypothetical protein
MHKAVVDCDERTGYSTNSLNHLSLEPRWRDDQPRNKTAPTMPSQPHDAIAENENHTMEGPQAGDGTVGLVERSRWRMRERDALPDTVEEGAVKCCRGSYSRW